MIILCFFFILHAKFCLVLTATRCDQKGQAKSDANGCGGGAGIRHLLATHSGKSFAYG